MSFIKFHEDYNINGVTFTRNAVYEYVDKHEEYDGDWVWIYRVDVNGIRYSIDGEYVVEIDEKDNNDYTWDEWKKKVTTDAMVKDGDYVSHWKRINGINEPVKKTAEQTDYDSTWRKTEQRARKHYREES